MKLWNTLSPLACLALLLPAQLMARTGIQAWTFNAQGQKVDLQVLSEAPESPAPDGEQRDGSEELEAPQLHVEILDAPLLRLSWQPIADATSYQILLGNESSLPTEWIILGSTEIFFDSTPFITDQLTRTFQVIAKN